MRVGSRPILSGPRKKTLPHPGRPRLGLTPFGRGICLLDDYTPLRGGPAFFQGGGIFPIRAAFVYEPIRYYSAGSGAGDLTAENPPYGAIFSFYLADGVAGEDAEVALVVRNSAGEVVAEVDGNGHAAWNRVVWNLRSSPPPSDPGGGRQGRTRRGPLVAPGDYEVSLEVGSGGTFRALGEPAPLRVHPLPNSGWH